MRRDENDDDDAVADFHDDDDDDDDGSGGRMHHWGIELCSQTKWTLSVAITTTFTIILRAVKIKSLIYGIAH